MTLQKTTLPYKSPIPTDGRIVRIDDGYPTITVYTDPSRDPKSPKDYTVGDLIEYLNTFDRNTPVYGCGSVRDYDLSIGFQDDFCYVDGKGLAIVQHG